MVKAFLNGLFLTPHREVIILFRDKKKRALHVLTHSSEEMFRLDKHQRAATAACAILRQGFSHIYQHTDLCNHGFTEFEQDRVKYSLVKFGSPVVSEPGVDGFQKLKEAGFDFVMIGDHPLAPKIKKAIGQK